LHGALEEHRELVQKLQADLERLETTSREKEESDGKKINDLTREVDVLKNQLKKYVAAVQTLRKDTTSTEGTPIQSESRNFCYCTHATNYKFVFIKNTEFSSR